jgi:RNA polymerase sigma-70 factor (ECF subfamily)
MMLMFYLAALDTEEDKRTFEDIYTRYEIVALRVALRVSHNNHAIAEDAVQNAFMQIIKDWEKFLETPCDKWRSRIVIIVKNKTIDIMRKEKKFVPLDDYSELSDGEPDLSVVFERKDDAEFLRTCVAKLPDIYKVPIQLRYFHGLNNSEIATVLGITPHNATVRISRALTLLCEIVKKEGADNQ